MHRAARRVFIASFVTMALAGCATSEDLYRKQPVRLPYEVGDKVYESRQQFQDLWNWYLGAIDPKAPTTEIEVCLTIAPDGRVIDSYIDSATIRRKEFVAEVLKIYSGMRFTPREVPELTICDDPLLFYALGAKPEEYSTRHRTSIVPRFEPEEYAPPPTPPPAEESAMPEPPPEEAPVPVDPSVLIPVEEDKGKKKSRRKKR